MAGLEYACADDWGGGEIVTFDPKTGDQREIQKQIILVVYKAKHVRRRLSG